MKTGVITKVMEAFLHLIRLKHNQSKFYQIGCMFQTKICNKLFSKSKHCPEKTNSCVTTTLFYLLSFQPSGSKISNSNKISACLKTKSNEKNNRIITLKLPRSKITLKHSDKNMKILKSKIPT